MKIFRILINKLTLLMLLVAIAAAGGYSYWQQGKKTSEKNRFKTVTIENGDVTQVVSANGTLNPVVLVSVGTQVSGTVKKLYADFNDKVQKGQILVELDPAIYQAQVMQDEANIRNAQASIDLAQANEARMKSLLDQEYVSRQEYDQSVQAFRSSLAQRDLARAQLQKDKTNLAYTIIRAPVSGVVVSREVDTGQTVAASFQTPTLFKIAQDLRQMQIDSSFAEADIGKIKVGQTVNFTVDAYAGKNFEGTVKQVRLNPTNVSNVITYDVVVSVDNPDQILLPGMTAYVGIAVAAKTDVLLIPNAALRFRLKDVSLSKADDNKLKNKDAEHAGKKKEASASVVVLENGQPKKLRIKTGITDSKMTEVLEGKLKVGDQVIIEDTQDSANASASNGGGNMKLRMF